MTYIQKPNITLIAAWLDEAWKSIPGSMIKNSFLKCGISNAIDGSENDALFVDNAGDHADDEAYTEDNDYREDQVGDVPDEFFNKFLDE